MWVNYTVVLTVFSYSYSPYFTQLAHTTALNNPQPLCSMTKKWPDQKGLCTKYISLGQTPTKLHHVNTHSDEITRCIVNNK